MDRRVRYRLVEWFQPTRDPITGAESNYTRRAFHGQTLHTDGDVSDDTHNDLYGVPVNELRRLEHVHEGIFYSEQELDALEAGVTDDVTPDEGDGGVRGNTNAVDRTPDGEDSVPTPLTFAQMAVWQIAEYLRKVQPTPDDILEALENEPGATRADVAYKFLDAENEVTGGEPREELVQGVAALLGHSPVGAEAHETTGEGGDGGEDGGGASDSGPEPTEAALDLAHDKGVDISKITGSGAGGRVTQGDVQRYLAENPQ